MFNQVKTRTKMEQKTIFELIREWASERGLYKDGSVDRQFIKLGEEYGELAEALLKNDLSAKVDAIGDMIVVLTNLAHLINNEEFDKDIMSESITIEYCIECAYDQIKNRKGSMKNGTFVKND
jgi:NTP pyrophosphatase (non-canonical NTP hydrolase)